jgi:hypothetical protein
LIAAYQLLFGTPTEHALDPSDLPIDVAPAPAEFPHFFPSEFERLRAEFGNEGHAVGFPDDPEHGLEIVGPAAAQPRAYGVPVCPAEFYDSYAVRLG